MAISFACRCGKQFSVGDQHAGKKAKCPSCQAIVVVPKPPAAIEDDLPGLSPLDDPLSQAPVVDALSPSLANPFGGTAPVNRIAQAAGGPPPADKPQWFSAFFSRGLYNAKLFRIYPDTDSLLVIHICPFHETLLEGLMQAGNAARGQMMTTMTMQHGAAGAAVGAAAAGLNALMGMKFQYDKKQRDQALDAMGIDELRKIADTEAPSFRVTKTNVASVVIDPPSTAMFTADENAGLIPAYLRFKHDKTGQWHLQLPTEYEVGRAVYEMRRVCGAGNVSVQLKV